MCEYDCKRLKARAGEQIGTRMAVPGGLGTEPHSQWTLRLSHRRVGRIQHFPKMKWKTGFYSLFLLKPQSLCANDDVYLDKLEQYLSLFAFCIFKS